MGALRHQPVDAGLALVMRGRTGRRIDSVDAQDRHIKRDLVEHACRERPGQLIRLRPGHSPGLNALFSCLAMLNFVMPARIA
jgi:hypothetical protein